MKATSTGIINGVIAEKYAKYGTQFNENGVPTYSLPLAIEDAPHLYDLHVFALDTGFYLNELYKKMDGHILAQCTLQASYNN